jgi:Ca-activated chloride channel family protein
VNLTFDWPFALAALALLPLLLVWERRAPRREAAVQLSTLGPARDSPRTWRTRLRWLPGALRLAALALLIVALARPQAGRADAVVPAEGIDIVLALDSSSSMRTPVGGQRSRLDVVRGVLGQFVATRENDRLGLVVFRARSFALSPLTLDYSSFQGLLQNVGRIDLADGTAVGIAIADSLNLLRDSTAQSRIIILLTDGENNRQEVTPLTAARLAQTLGVRVYTIGAVGGPGLISEERLGATEQALSQIAEVTEGQYYRAENPETLAEVYRSIDELERSRLGGERFAAADELAPWLLLPGLALIAAEVALRTSLLRRLP